ncbi:cyclic nucleotide-binding domain-containing protein [Colwellia sp. PAMC 20917]|uniref:cyclic nucleotide-binding domain-containing protein n=1 Tax=Colwellia sp. PAMC 20917 TaxID=1816218 RepID=UPI000877FD00|nr:cyclic nucleotide-binding domain-containing protein [Colwellia sp. PAMC 20917]
MTEQYKIVVIGAGPGGISAAAHAAELNISHVLLEASPKIANTIQKYQKGKHVMAEPSILPLRSPIAFEAGKRETILDEWLQGLLQNKVNLKYNAAVVNIDGQKGDYTITLANGDVIKAEFIILGIGVQGNPRKLGVTGDDADFVQYTLDNPDDHNNETIVIVGAGDAAIENAVVLAKNNKVYIVNRRDEFARAKEGNLNLITAAIDSGDVECCYNTNPHCVELTPDQEKPGVFVLKTASGEISVPVDRIIARLGAIPPRALVESFGIEFPNSDPNSIPVLSAKYESNVAGMYVIGALGGYPLIKQAMNQGYEVVEYILGNDINPADHPLLESKLEHLPFDMDVDQILSKMQTDIPVFTPLSALSFRELMLDSQVHVFEPNKEIFKKNDYTNSFYTILQGEVNIVIGDRVIKSTQGNFFGEMSLISGRRRSATVLAGESCIVIETPRRTMIKLITSVDAVKRVLDETFIVRIIQEKFAPKVPIEQLQPIAKKAKLNQYRANEVLFSEGDEANCLHVIRNGSVTVSKKVGDKDIPMTYVAANNVVGEMGLLGNTVRSATITATVKTETISIDSDSFNDLLAKSPTLRETMELEVQKRHLENTKLESDSETGDILSFLMQQGLGEATDVLLINEDTCVGCDNCETACAATHGGTSRLNRKAGPTFAHVHVPTSCRHCEDPSCMKDCPPDAIHRGGLGGEVFIDDSCIGCGNCERNCPYGVIQMEYPKEKNTNFWPWMFFNAGEKPGDNKVKDGDNIKKAVKCDMCKDIEGGAACVRACPTGAANRISPENFIKVVNL